MVNTFSQNRQEKKRQLFIEIGIAIGAIILLAVILPLILSPFRLQLLGRFLALTIVALGIDLIWGYTGLLSLGHGIFFALGGYGIAMHLKLQLPDGQLPEFFTLYGVSDLPWFWKPFYSFPFTVVAIFVIPAIVAGILGYLVFRNRIKGVYFSIITQTAQFAFYQSSIIFLLLAYLVCRWFTSGRFGRLLIAIRDDENRVRFSGYNPTGFKVLVFAISGAIAGVSGALYTLQTGIITPSIMEVAFSIEMVIWVAVGGRGTLLGAIIGTLLVRFGQTFLSEKFPEVWLFFQGALFLMVVTVLPDGIVGWWNNWAWFKLKSIFGLQPKLVTYPAIDKNPEVESEELRMKNK